MTFERWRLFVAVPIGDDLRRDLAAAVEEWKKRPDLAGLRWTDPESWHVTLAFVGATEPTSVPALSVAIGDVAAAHARFSSPIASIGAFPSASRARVVWCGVRDDDGALADLALDVRAAVTLDSEAPFRAHVTLARGRRDSVDVRSWLNTVSVPEGMIAVDRLKLMRSHLGPGVRRYDTLAAIGMDAPAGV